VRELLVNSRDKVVLHHRDRQRARGGIGPDDVLLLDVRPLE
jgi:hypothetical protein